MPHYFLWILLFVFGGCTSIVPLPEVSILGPASQNDAEQLVQSPPPLKFLPFEIPLDCNTDLTPFGFLDVNLSDICQCSCEPFLSSYENTQSLKLIKTIDLLGRFKSNYGFYIEMYEDLIQSDLMNILNKENEIVSIPRQ